MDEPEISTDTRKDEYVKYLKAFVDDFSEKAKDPANIPAKKHPEDVAVRDAWKGYNDLIAIVIEHKFEDIDKHDLMTDFTFGVDERLPPTGDVRGKMIAEICTKKAYKRMKSLVWENT